MPHPHQKTIAASLADLAAAVAEAKENSEYWRRQAILLTHPDAIAQARGLAAAWKSTLAARRFLLDRANSLPMSRQ